VSRQREWDNGQTASVFCGRTVRANVTIDWTVRGNARTQLRVLVKRILRKYGYPPDKQNRTTQTVFEQAELLSEGWAGFIAPDERPLRPIA
jgi:hypothetical protein